MGTYQTGSFSGGNNTVTFPVKSLDLVFFDIEIVTLSELFKFLEMNIVLNRFSHRLVQKKPKNIGKVKKNH